MLAFICRDAFRIPTPNRGTLTNPPETPKRTAPRQATGTAGLDEILNGGLPANRLYVVEGEPAGVPGRGPAAFVQGREEPDRDRGPCLRRIRQDMLPAGQDGVERGAVAHLAPGRSHAESRGAVGASECCG